MPLIASASQQPINTLFPGHRAGCWSDPGGGMPKGKEVERMFDCLKINENTTLVHDMVIYGIVFGLVIACGLFVGYAINGIL
jgi:hypothetical protein